MPATVSRLSAAIAELSRGVRTRHTRIDERRAHDDAMRDRGIAEDHAASIARAVANGKPGCEFCA